jgi:hypothetical protein
MGFLFFLAVIFKNFMGLFLHTCWATFDVFKHQPGLMGLLFLMGFLFFCNLGGSKCCLLLISVAVIHTSISAYLLGLLLPFRLPLPIKKNSHHAPLYSTQAVPMCLYNLSSPLFPSPLPLLSTPFSGWAILLRVKKRFSSISPLPSLLVLSSYLHLFFLLHICPFLFLVLSLFSCFVRENIWYFISVFDICSYPISVWTNHICAPSEEEHSFCVILSLLIYFFHFFRLVFDLSFLFILVGSSNLDIFSIFLHQYLFVLQSVYVLFFGSKISIEKRGDNWRKRYLSPFPFLYIYLYICMYFFIFSFRVVWTDVRKKFTFCCILLWCPKSILFF